MSERVRCAAAPNRMPMRTRLSRAGRRPRRGSSPASRRPSARPSPGACSPPSGPSPRGRRRHSSSGVAEPFGREARACELGHAAPSRPAARRRPATTNVADAGPVGCLLGRPRARDRREAARERVPDAAPLGVGLTGSAAALGAVEAAELAAVEAAGGAAEAGAADGPPDPHAASDERGDHDQARKRVGSCGQS